MSTPSIQDQLAPPGAGVPWWELLWVRPVLRFASAVLSDSRLTARFTSEAAQMCATVARLAPQQAQQRVLIDRITGIEDSSRYWSACMVLEHLRIVDVTIADIIATLSRGAGYAHEIRTADVKPAPSVGREVIAAFSRTVDTYVARTPAALAVQSKARHPHPWFGPLDAHGWHCLAAVHHTLHRRQLGKIIAGLDRGGSHASRA
jgi:hypothetical protein